MGYTELYKVPCEGEIQLVAEYHNAFRGAFLVWDTLSKKYLHRDASMMLLATNDTQPLWDLWKSPRVPFETRLVLGSTFDNVMVKRENLEILADALEYYAQAVTDPGHIATQIDKLRELAQDDTCFAVCWVQTTVTDAWHVYDAETEDSRLYDVSKDSEHWFLFDHIEHFEGDGR